MTALCHRAMTVVDMVTYDCSPSQSYDCCRYGDIRLLSCHRAMTVVDMVTYDCSLSQSYDCCRYGDIRLLSVTEL